MTLINKALRHLIAPLMVFSVMLPIGPVYAIEKQTHAVSKIIKHNKIKKHKRVILHPKKIAERASRSMWNSSRQWRCLEWIWTQDSHFNPKARNKHSGAYGIAQFLPKTWGSRKKTSDPKVQIKYGLNYINSRYGTPCHALAFKKRHGWY